MNRRSILSSLSAGALALLAPVAAWASGNRRTTCPTCGQAWNATITGEYPCPECGMPVSHDETPKDWAKRVRADADSLRALLAEAREALMDAESALAWTSGASDFHPEGAAHGGWTKVVAPAMAQARDLKIRIDSALK